MKRAADRYEIASPTQQDLPGAAVRSSAGLAAVVERDGGRRAVASEFSAGGHAMPLDLSAPNTLEVERDVVGSRAPVDHDRLLQMIRPEVERVKANGNERVAVILRPDAETEIHLRVQVGQDGVQAYAHCRRGDIESLNSQWTQLQESLSSCGVRLAPLNATAAPEFNAVSTSPSSSGAGDSSAEDRSARQTPSWPRDDEVRPTLPRTAAGSTGRERREHLLELWA